jgi:hypothetical protein
VIYRLDGADSLPLMNYRVIVVRLRVAYLRYTMESSDLFQAHTAYRPAVWWNNGVSVKSKLSIQIKSVQYFYTHY